MKQDILEPGGIYHIYNRGNNKEDIFKEAKNYDYFMALMSKRLFPSVDLYAFCLLKNHFHWLLRIKDKKDLPIKYAEKPHLPFSNFFNAYTKSINKMYGRTGSLFQEHLKRKRVENENYLIQLIAYIHLNPVKHNFTENYKTYKYSSFRIYTSPKKTLLDRDFIFSVVDKEVFEYWHDEKRLKNEILLLDFFNGME